VKTPVPARPARGCVVVVEPAPELGHVGRPIVRAANLFDAVGEVTVASATRPIAAVVVPASLVEGPASITIEAFRRIDPSVRLILVAPADRVAATDGNGFDDVLAEPLTTDALARALGNGEGRPPPELEPASAERPAAERAVTPPPVTTPAHDDEDGDDGDELAALEIEVPVSGLPDELGDVDLVERILGGKPIAACAVALVVQQTGWTDLQFEARPPAGEGWSCVEVRCGSKGHGMLATRQAAPRQLRPWAEWLARWLTLDHRHRELRRLAYRDELTGAWNRRFYNIFMKQLLERAHQARRAVTVLVFDIDDFKQYNDRFGHEAGDEILRETVRLLKSVIRAGDRVCRMGGDEFVVIFSDLNQPRKAGSNPPDTVEQIAGRFQTQICQMKFPKLGIDAPGTLSISGGLATYPWDGGDAAALLRRADELALESKRSGKNAITLGPGARQAGLGSDPGSELE